MRNPELYAKMVRDIYKSLGGKKEGKETLRDVVQHGADAGYSGFIYYKDTCAFYERNKEAIWELLDDDAQEQGTTILAMLGSFAKADLVSDVDTFENLMAWYALEAVAQREVGSE